jgi:transcriptional regulator with XRE-family HTH domain
LRSTLRMSQAALARRSGLPQAHIARLETRKTDVQLSKLQRRIGTRISSASRREDRQISGLRTSQERRRQGRHGIWLAQRLALGAPPVQNARDFFVS